MVVVYSESAGCSLEAIVRDAVAPVPVRAARDRGAFRESLAESEVAILAVPALGREETEWILDEVGRSPGPELVIVAPLSIDALQHSRDLVRRGGRVVWAEEASERLGPAAAAALGAGRDPMQALGSLILDSPGLRPLLRDVVSHICRLRIGITIYPRLSSCVLGDLAASVDVDSGTYRRALATAHLDRRSEQLIGWSLLLRACGEDRSAGKPFASVSRDLALPPRTPSRCAIRLLGQPLHLAQRAPQRVEARFRLWQAECDRFGSYDPPPPTTVGAISGLWSCDPSTLGGYWRGEMPLRCRPKEMLSWSVLWWAIGQRRRGHSWPTVAHRSGCQRRSLQRYSCRLVGCSLGAAAEGAVGSRRIFWSWVGARMAGGGLALRRRATIPIMSHCSPNCVFRDGVAHPIVRSRNDAGGSPDAIWAAPIHPPRRHVMFGVKTIRKLLLTAVVAALATMPVAAESSPGKCKYSKKYGGLFCGGERKILSCKVAGPEEGDPDTCWVTCGRDWVEVDCLE